MAKKGSGKTTSKKKAAARKKAARRTSSKKKAAQKKTAKKTARTGAKKGAGKATGKGARKSSARRTSAKKKTKTKKKAAAKKTAKKKGAAGKKPAKKAAAKKGAAKKKTSAKKAPQKRKTPASRKPAPARPAAVAATAGAAPRRSGRRIVDAPSTLSLVNFAPYKPRRGEEYMSEDQIEHFRGMLNEWKRQLMEEVDRTLHHMQDEAANFPDPNDRATQESEFTLELRTRDRERKLIKKIDESLITLDSGDYGFCESCGVEIGIRRLEARPTATLCIDCKILDEIREKQMG